jgi:predicted dehydrogenase
VAYVGFNMRAATESERLKELVDSGLLGRILHVEGLEQLSVAHSASFMRRFHRKRENTGGLLNHKCCHDLDRIFWLIGHGHRVIKVASFGGMNVFLSRKPPARTCRECPADVSRACPYQDRAGFVFPVQGERPIHHQSADIYGADLCVYNEDKSIFDNQTVILEWDHGVRGNFNIQLFQARGYRETRIWGEKGFLQAADGKIRTVLSATGEVVDHAVAAPGEGGHGGTDPKMMARFVAALDGADSGDSGLAQGLAVTLVAEKAERSALSGQVMRIAPGEYAG